MPPQLSEEATKKISRENKRTISIANVYYDAKGDVGKKQPSYQKFPQDAIGYLYLHTPAPGEPSSQPNVRFRVVPDPPSPSALSRMTKEAFLTQFWQHGHDLSLEPRGAAPALPWSLPIAAICATSAQQALWRHIVDENLLDEAILSDLAQHPCTRIRKGKSSQRWTPMIRNASDTVIINLGQKERLRMLDRSKQKWAANNGGLCIFASCNWQGWVKLQFQLSKDPVHADKDVFVFKVIEVDPDLKPRTSKRRQFLKPVSGQMLMQVSKAGEVGLATFDLDMDITSVKTRSALKSLVQHAREQETSGTTV